MFPYILCAIFLPSFPLPSFPFPQRVASKYKENSLHIHLGFWWVSISSQSSSSRSDQTIYYQEYQTFLMHRCWSVPWHICNETNVSGRARWLSNVSCIHLPYIAWMTCWKEWSVLPHAVRSMWQPPLCGCLSDETGWLCFIFGWKRNHQIVSERHTHHLGCFVKLEVSTRKGLHFFIWDLKNNYINLATKSEGFFTLLTRREIPSPLVKANSS